MRHLPLLALCMLLCSSAMAKGLKQAIVIGAQDYDDRNIQDLKLCVNDAIALAKALVDADTCAFAERNVALLHTSQRNRHTKPTLANVQRELQSILGKAEADDTILLYFSGHGVIDPRSKKGYLVLQDTRVAKIAKTALAIDSLLDLLKECRAAKKLLILDCCHSGYSGKRLFLEENGYEQPGPESLLKPFSGVKGASIVTMASCHEDQISYEWINRGNGYFTAFLIDGLQNGFADADGDGQVDSTELFTYVRGRVVKQVEEDEKEKQEPVLVVSDGGKVPAIPLARAQFPPWSLQLRGQQNGLPPKNCTGAMIVQGGKLEPDFRGNPQKGNYFLLLPKLPVRKSFVASMTFQVSPNDDNSAGLSLFPQGGAPWHFAVHSRGGITAAGRTVVPRGRYLNPGLNHFELTRIVSERGSTIEARVNGRLIGATPIHKGPIPQIKLGLYYGGRRNAIPAITAFEVRPK